MQVWVAPPQLRAKTVQSAHASPSAPHSELLWLAYDTHWPSSPQQPSAQSVAAQVPSQPSSAPAHLPAQSGSQSLQPLAEQNSPAAQRTPSAAHTHVPLEQLSARESALQSTHAAPP